MLLGPKLGPDRRASTLFSALHKHARRFKNLPHLLHRLHSKTTWEEVNASLAVSEATSRQLASAAEGYRPVALRAAVLYFVLADLGGLDPMYQFSLDAYTALFAGSLRASPRPVEGGLVARIKALNDWHTYAVYKYAARSLFGRHKLLLSLHMCARVLAAAGQVAAEEWGFLLRGGQVRVCAFRAKGCLPGGGVCCLGPSASPGAISSALACLALLHPLLLTSPPPSTAALLTPRPQVLDRSQQPLNPCKQWLNDEAWDNLTCLDALPGGMQGRVGGRKGARELIH